MSSSAAKFDMRINPPYQVDWQNAASGKRVSATKRRVRFRFGFSNREAIAQGLRGVECRGEEHEVVLVWSLTSGKRLVMADGQEVHFSYGKRTDGKFETSWTMVGGHIIKLIAYAAPPLFPTPGFRMFDLLLDGCSFFDMPKIFELGSKATKALAVRPGAGYSNYTVSPVTPSPSSRRSSEDPRDSPEYVTPKRPSRIEAEPVDVLSDTTDMDLLDAPVSYDQPSQPATDAFIPVSPPQPAQPSFESVSSQIMSTYAPPASTPVLALANESHTYYVPPPPPPSPQQPQQQYQYQQQQPQNYQYQPQMQQTYYSPPPQQQAYYTPQAPAPVSPDASMHSSSSSHDASSEDAQPKAVLTMQPLSAEELESREQPPVSALEKAVQSLVHLDDITEKFETPEQMKLRKKKSANQPPRSKPLPPTKAEWHLGTKPKLGDLKEHAPPKAPPTKEIMRTHAFDPRAAQAGMMVVYGQSIPSAQGFGAGVHPSHYYAQQQMMQQQPYYGQQRQQHQAYAAY